MVRMSLKMDWRGSRNPWGGIHQAKKSKFPPLMLVIFTNFFFSLVLSIPFALGQELFFALVISSLGGMFFLTLQMLLEFNNLIITPTDYLVISPHPVNSRTFYTAKLIHLSVYVGILTAALAFLPALAAAVKYHSLLAAVGTLVTFSLGNLFAAFFVVNLYVFIIKKLKRSSMEKVLGYLQLLLMFLSYLSLISMSQIIAKAGAFDFSRLTWLFLSPSYWFAAWVKMWSQGWNPTDFGTGMFGIAVLVLAYQFGASYLSLTYAESLAKPDDSKSSASRGRIYSLLSRFLNSEEKAVLLLIRAQFQHDTKFRLTLMWLFGIMIAYLVYGSLNNMVVRNPFNLAASGSSEGNFLFSLALAYLPIFVGDAVKYSPSFRAAWVFYATPLDRLKLVLAVKKVMILFFVVPFSLFLCAVFLYYFHNIVHALLHTFFLVLLTILVLSVYFMFQADVPFSKERTAGQTSASMIGMLLLASVISILPIILLSFLGYGGYGWYTFFVVCLIGINLFLTNRQRRSFAKRIRTWEFEA